MTIRIKRVYEPAADSDGERILVDRIWPRGVSRKKASLSAWEKEVAPSTALRKWFGHKPEHWQEFRRRYRAELRHNPAVRDLRATIGRKRVTLLYGTHDEAHNHALVLAAYLKRKPAKAKKTVKKSAGKKS